MGLFDGLISKVKRALSRAFNRKVDNAVSSSVSNAFTRKTGRVHESYNGAANSGYNQYATQARPAAHRNIVAELRIMLNAYKQLGYEIRENVSASIFDASLEGQGIRNYNFVVYSNGSIVMCVMVTDHNRDRNRAFLVAKRVCENSGTPFVNFYTHFPNDSQYMAERIRSYLA